MVLAGLGLSVAFASAYYLVADVRYARGLELFAAGQMEPALTEHRAAQRMLPGVDTFRVAEADAATYLGGFYLEDALDSLDSGLAIEQDSYDLALARARMLAALGRPVSEVADAYVSSVKLYPLGVEVRIEAVQVLYAANRAAEAAEMERELMRLQDAVRKGLSP
jgi:tetratricopeptide (TPR) repeat protein